MFFFLYSFPEPVLATQPLKGIPGQPTSIYCRIFTQCENSSDISLQFNGTVITNETRFTIGITNMTHREFILNPAQPSDYGSSITCHLGNFSSPTLNLLIGGK